MRRITIVNAVDVAAVLAFTLATACATVQRQPEYLLPFGPGSHHSLVQGFDGRYGHSGVNAFAYDFRAEIGTVVTAARAGTAIHVVESNEDSPPRQPRPGQENVIVIDHGDGTFGRYYHLTRNGADIQPGQKVKAGQPIGRSGNSGASFMPHLHFDVTEKCFEYGCPTVRFRFAGIEQQPLQEGASYSR